MRPVRRRRDGHADTIGRGIVETLHGHRSPADRYRNHYGQEDTRQPSYALRTTPYALRRAQTKFSSMARIRFNCSGAWAWLICEVTEKVRDRRPSGVAAISWV